MTNRTSTTLHHLLPKSRNGTNDDDNKLVMRETQHRALHTLFSNDTPVEQVARILELNESALQGDFLNDMREVLDLYGEDVYNSSVRKQRQGVKQKSQYVLEAERLDKK